ncbi:MAG: hypothetical protein MR923_13285 [Prevotella sp.]|nr:hypothetical protein [Prevotella sp.]
MTVVVVLLLSLLVLGVLAAVWSRVSSSGDDDTDAIVTRPTCATCNGEDTRCEQECMMEAATREVEYYDDEELDRFKGRPSDCFTDDEAELFREVLLSMPQSDAKGWNRSLILRGINVPDQIKDELLLMIDGDS